MQDFRLVGKSKPLSIFERPTPSESGKNLESSNKGMKDFMASYNTSKSNLPQKITSLGINSYIPPTEVKKTFNHFHDRVKIDDAALSSIKDYFLTDSEYKKLQDFTKSLLVERFGGYYTLMKLKKAKPSSEWIDQMEEEFAENARDLYELY